MKKDGIIMMENGVKNQIALELTFREALSMVRYFRSKNDGNYYWIGVI